MLLSLCGLRGDGRRAEEVRRLSCKTSILPDSDGSCEFKQGLTTVIATVQGPRQVEYRSDAKHDRAIIRCQISVAPFSTTERKKRRINDRRGASLASLIEETFGSVVQTQLFQGGQIDVNIHVVETDGSFIAAAINAVSVALVDAGVPMIDFVGACSVGYVDSVCLVDLTYAEESGDCPALTLAMLCKSKNVITMKMTSERTRISENILIDLLKVGSLGCSNISELVENTLVEEITNSLKNL